MCDLWRGRLTYRRLDLLIRNLPEDSRTQTILRDQPRPEPVADAARKFGPWALGDYLTVHLIDAVRHNTYMVAVASGRFNDPKPPEPFPRPGLAAKPTKPTDMPRENSEDVVLYLSKLRARG